MSFRNSNHAISNYHRKLGQSGQHRQLKGYNFGILKLLLYVIVVIVVVGASGGVSVVFSLPVRCPNQAALKNRQGTLGALRALAISVVVRGRSFRKVGTSAFCLEIFPVIC